jgi:hypothetical protein
MNRSLFFIALLFMTLIASCTNREQESQSKEVTMLIVTRDSLETVFAQNKFDSLNYWRQEASNIELSIKRNYYATKVDQNLSRKMNRFKSLQEIIDAESELGGEGEYEEEEKEMTLGRRMMLLNSGFKKEKISLENLQSDLENKLLDSKKSSTYIQAERMKVKQMENQLTQYLFVKNTELKEYIKLCKELRVFADSISKKTSEST